MLKHSPKLLLRRNGQCFPRMASTQADRLRNEEESKTEAMRSLRDKMQDKAIDVSNFAWSKYQQVHEIVGFKEIDDAYREVTDNQQRCIVPALTISFSAGR